MVDISLILALLKIISCGFNIPFALIYSIPILFIRRFHHRNNIITLYISFSVIFCSSFWLVYYIMFEFYIEYLYRDKTCPLLFFLIIMCTCQMPFTFLIITINRFCPIVYSTKAFFKTKKFMAICLGSQLTVSCLVSMPFPIFIKSVS